MGVLPDVTLTMFIGSIKMKPIAREDALRILVMRGSVTKAHLEDILDNRMYHVIHGAAKRHLDAIWQHDNDDGA
jgi:hypothetical protein